MNKAPSTQKKDSTHSPLPWIKWPTLTRGDQDPGRWEIYNRAQPYWIARIIEEADADLIVRAVNSHGALVAALEEFLEGAGFEDDPVRIQARAALRPAVSADHV